MRIRSLSLKLALMAIGSLAVVFAIGILSLFIRQALVALGRCSFLVHGLMSTLYFLLVVTLCLFSLVLILWLGRLILFCQQRFLDTFFSMQ